MTDIKKMITIQDSEQISRYFADVKNYPLIEPENEKEIVGKAQAGDKEALERVIHGNLRFVVSIAKQYQGRGVPLLDLISEGNVGLMEAVHRFDPERDIRFISYAVWWIRCTIMNNFSKNNRLIKIPSNRSIFMGKVKRKVKKMEQKSGRTPTEEEVAEEFPDYSFEEVVEAIALVANPLSLDEPMSDDEGGITRQDTVSSNDLRPDEIDDDNHVRESINNILSDLTQKEIDVIVLLYGLNGEDGLTPNRLAQMMDVGTSHIFTLKNRAMRKLKKHRDVIKGIL